jgi:hypothetical protein
VPAKNVGSEPAATGAVRIQEAACWAHLRRDFHDVWKATSSPIAKQALDRIGALYDIERNISGQSTSFGWRLQK